MGLRSCTALSAFFKYLFLAGPVSGGTRYCLSELRNLILEECVSLICVCACEWVWAKDTSLRVKSMLSLSGLLADNNTAGASV